MTQKTTHHEDPELQIENALSKSELFLQRNGKKLLITLCVIVGLIAIYFGYTHLIQTPQEEKASTMAFAAQQQFATNDFSLALNGDGEDAGFIEVAEKFGSTPTGNIANHYAGICYLRLGDYNNAIKYLEKYKAVEGAAAEIINAQNLGLTGDAYAQLKDNDKALSFYEKAIASSDNSLTAPYYLLKAGGMYEAKGDSKKALECYENIKNNYFQSLEAREIDKYIGRIAQ